MVHKSDMALLMTASGALAKRKALIEISSESKVSRVMPSKFATKHASLHITHLETC